MALTSEQLRALIAEWTEMYIRQNVDFPTGKAVTEARLEELFNLLIDQCDNSSQAIAYIKQYFDVYVAELQAERDGQTSTFTQLKNDTLTNNTETKAATSADAASALASKNAAALSATDAATSKNAAAASANAAATSALNAKGSENAASASAGTALASKNAAALSETNALASKNAASVSETNALAYKNSALDSMNSATSSKNAASASAADALASKNAASASATTSVNAADAANAAATNATNSANAAAVSEDNAAASAQAALTAAEKVFDIAAGTATAITVGSAELLDMHYTTFIAKYNNNSAATTINAKPLYKPNTTTAPNIVAGKAYTVWYSTTGNCFFLKASAEGNALAGYVLAGYTYSNDSDTGIAGTMTDNMNQNLLPASLYWDQQNLFVECQTGYHDNTFYTLDTVSLAAAEPNLDTNNIKSGAIIFGIDGNPNVVDTSTGDAIAANILSGKKAFVDGALVTGTMEAHIAGNILANAATYDGGGNIVLTPPTGFYDGANGKVYGYDADLIPANILNIANIFGIQGTALAAKKSASGTGVSCAPYITGYYSNTSGGVQLVEDYYQYITVTGLTFTPSVIFVYRTSGTSYLVSGIFFNAYPGIQKFMYLSGSEPYNLKYVKTDTHPELAYKNATSFRMPVIPQYPVPTYDWLALE